MNKITGKTVKLDLPQRHQREMKRALRESVVSLRDQIDRLAEEFLAGKLSNEELKAGVREAKRMMVMKSARAVTKILVAQAIKKLSERKTAAASV